ncbi:uncharacterized protein BDR25DRAFT_263143 [Lindgomyces ingoldianus]|uniref:Uncharacterized protein n=1 Tax=Lindgomyces ingoldianus TaxID=673940 RepID=A0ACB6QRW9_9PLEO|nr:uncharacterized protein BDR25DRAFT_263143 [Lindgomyces ingoldianus]KAF2469774.1 hypothetical protein BDR25DRAFT_263143 [Lindgomyces ingoldianus]
MLEAEDPMDIAPGGDLILEVRQDEGSGAFSYRVESKMLRQNSRYFDSLLSGRFSEGQQLSAALEALKIDGHPEIAHAPADTLPRIPIVNVGRISKVSTIQTLTADFLRALHGHDLAVTNPPVANLANLAVVADRFDAHAHLARYVQRKKYLHAIDAKTRGKPSTGMSEERVRQKLLIGLLLDHPPWVTRYSKQLMLRDSEQWKPDFEANDKTAMWWDMPGAVEDEMIQRREYILETVNSLQSHFLKLYTSGERQCKLGYDSSIQCDSFQLGEMVRFFTKLGTLRLQGTIYDPAEPDHYSGDINRLLESLRQCSSYQVDRNHSHCGLRVRLLPLLDLIQIHLSLDTGSLDIGICGECWSRNRPSYAWSLAKRPVLWTQSRSLTGNRTLASLPKKKVQTREHQGSPGSCLPRHLIVRDMFMAAERDWTARDADSILAPTTEPK